METFKDILTRQVETLQHYFDTCAETLAAHNAETHRLGNGGFETDSDDDMDGDLTLIRDRGILENGLSRRSSTVLS